MGENLLCFGAKPMPFAFPNSKLGTANLKLSFVPRCLRAPQRVLGETFKEGPKHRKKDGKQLELGESR